MHRFKRAKSTLGNGSLTGGNIQSVSGRRISTIWRIVVQDSSKARVWVEMDNRCCAQCGVKLPNNATCCPVCDKGRASHNERPHGNGERRYIYVRRTSLFSHRIFWIILVLLIGRIIILLTQLIVFLRAKNLVMVAPVLPRPALALVAAKTANDPGGRSTGGLVYQDETTGRLDWHHEGRFCLSRETRTAGRPRGKRTVHIGRLLSWRFHYDLTEEG